MGRRGTNPVLKYVSNKGIASATEVSAHAINPIENASNGLSDLKREIIVQRMRIPSRYVLSLLVEPSGLDP
ncbi:MAG: hypothetical protein NTAFB09_06080 [Nitrosospira sp.]